MEYSKIQGFTISKYTLGTVQLGMPYGIANKSGQPNIKQSFDILETAVRYGINAIDMAADYGTAEEVVGKYLLTLKNNEDKPLLVTKFAIRQAENLTDDDIERQVRIFVENSVQHLQIKKLQILLLHNAADMYLYGSPISKTLRKLINEGLVGKVGVSVYTASDVEKMLEEDLYEVVQLPLNIMDHRLVKRGIIEKLRQKEIVIFVRSVFLQGLFFLNPDELPANLKDAREPLLQLRQLANEEGISVAQLALSYIRDMDGITSLVVGAEKPEQVRSNAELINSAPLSENVRSRIEGMFLNVPNHVLNPSVWNVPEIWDDIDKED
jgi:aryl-alcohol dehydrogenase-like predicted oxidoreductase